MRRSCERGLRRGKEGKVERNLNEARRLEGLLCIRLFTGGPSVYARERKSERSEHKARGGGEWVSRFPTPTQSSFSFCAGVQFSCDSIHAFNDPIKIQENRGLWRVYYVQQKHLVQCDIPKLERQFISRNKAVLAELTVALRMFVSLGSRPGILATWLLVRSRDKVRGLRQG